MAVVALLVVESGAVEVVVSVSVSEPDDSRSQLSATGLDLGLCAGFCGTVVESLRCESVVAISSGAVSGVKLCGCVEAVMPVSLGVLRMESVADMAGERKCMGDVAAVQVVVCKYDSISEAGFCGV